MKLILTESEAAHVIALHFNHSGCTVESIKIETPPPNTTPQDLDLMAVLNIARETEMDVPSLMNAIREIRAIGKRANVNFTLASTKHFVEALRKFKANNP